jgi:hypothetical protein
MLHRPAASKIRAEHLGRQALIYVRQSTPIQVRENTASTARQYDLARRARELAWPGPSSASRPRAWRAPAATGTACWNFAPGPTR